MPRVDETPLDPDAVDSLLAVDAVLAGEPVDPRHCELAELALLVADERPAIEPGFAATLDERFERRFTSASAQRTSQAARRPWWLWTPAAGVAVVLVAAVVVVATGGGTSHAPVTGAARSQAAKLPSASSGRSTATPGPSASAAFRPSRTSSGALSGSSNALSTPQAAVVQPPASGGKTIRGANLALSTAPGRIEQVAQEVFVVVGQVRGIVSSSTVTATGGPGGYAQFELSIPSTGLSQAMASLSSLRYARVASRTDTTQNVNNRYETDVRALADARALRTSLLKQLANASTQAQIDSLTARIHDAEASISSDEATLRNLQRQVNFSQVSLTINGGPLPVPVHSQGGGFGLGKAAHDAGRVLTVAAGITLIAAAALVPLVLIGALGWWASAALRRRRREQALDLV